MAITGWSTSNYLRVLSGLGFTAADDLIMSGWMFEPVSINAGFMCDLGDTVSNDRRGVTSRLGGPPRASINEVGAGSIQANATVEEPNNAWYHLLGWYSDFDAAQIFLNGGNSGGASGAPVNPQDPNVFTIGANTPLGADAGATVGSGEISAWDPTSFTQQNIVDLAIALAAGDNPLALNAQVAQPWTGRLRRYYRLLNTGDLADLTGSGDDLAITGTLSNFATHPPVDPVPGIISKDTGVPLEALRTIRKVAGTRSAAGPTLLTDNFIGTDGAPLDTSKWLDESNGTAATRIDTNRAEFEYADVGNDNARLIVLDGSGANLQVSDCRAEYLVTLPAALGLQPSTAGLFSCCLRTDGLWAGGTTHDPNNGYTLFISVNDTGGAINGAMQRSVNGVNTALGTDFQIDDGTGGITQLNVRCEVLGDQVRMIARDAALGALPEGVWDNTATDATFAFGQAQLSARGPTGGGSPARFLWIDDITFSRATIIGGTPYEALADVRRDRAVPTESEGVDVISRDRVTPIEALTLFERANAVALESLARLTRDRVIVTESLGRVTRDRPVPIESLTSPLQDQVVLVESLFGLSRDRLAPFESEGVVVISRDLVIPFEALTLLELADTVAMESLIQLIRAQLITLESLIPVLRDRLVPFESEGVAVISQDVILPIESLLGARATRLVPLETRVNLVRDINVTLESLISLARERAVPFELFAALIAREIVVPFEAEGQIVVPPLEIQLIETAQPLTAQLVATLQALNILFLMEA